MPAAIGIATLMIALAVLGEPARDALQWTRSGSMPGEWWRFLTAHFIHLDLFHAMLNAAVLVAMASLFGDAFSPARHALHLCLGMLFIDVGLVALSDLDWYVGFSGVLHTLAAAAVVRLIIERHDPTAWGIALFGLGKITYENLVGAMPFTAVGTAVATDAHLFGVIAGMMAGLVPAVRQSS